MRGAFKMAIMALFIILTFSAAQAQFMAGYELVQAWEAYNQVDEGKGRDGDLGLGYLYMGYVTGVWDAIGYLLEPPSTINVGHHANECMLRARQILGRPSGKTS